MKSKINWSSSNEARIEIANFIRSRASGIEGFISVMTGAEIAKKDIEKSLAVVKELRIVADQIETGEL